MNILIQRVKLTQTGMTGDLSIEGIWRAFTMERQSTDAIKPCPAGEFALTLRPTFNAHLWTPYEDRCLPHIEHVPGREGIEIHAGNHAADSLGCVIVGFDRLQDMVVQARPAVTLLVNLMRADGAPSRIEIKDIPA
jgi:hypothetical protein